MKKFIFVALMSFVLIGMTACSKDKDLTGTKWAASIVETEEGYTITVDMLLSFNSETAGTLSATALGYTYSQDFTYTYDGKGEGTLTAKDPESGIETTEPFTIEGDKLTVKEATGDIVFTKQ